MSMHVPYTILDTKTYKETDLKKYGGRGTVMSKKIMTPEWMYGEITWLANWKTASWHQAQIQQLEPWILILHTSLWSIIISQQHWKEWDIFKQQVYTELTGIRSKIYENLTFWIYVLISCPSWTHCLLPLSSLLSYTLPSLFGSNDM